MPFPSVATIASRKKAINKIYSKHAYWRALLCVGEKYIGRPPNPEARMSCRAYRMLLSKWKRRVHWISENKENIMPLSKIQTWVLPVDATVGRNIMTPFTS